MRDRSEYKDATRARASIPAGFHIVRDGETAAGDIVYSWTSGEWLPIFSDLWPLPTPIQVSDCIAVARRPGIGSLFDGAARRDYRLTPGSVTPGTASQDPGRLF